ncbi:nicotinamide riboside transporter PnuC [Luteibacter sp.]|uniref:nicotinamide riboside transporter PnuC n=1 Tax=Luteibacter sp. TaxID=1886636 RepID=UPI002F422259
MSPFEVSAALVSAAGVWLTARRSPWCWPVGLVSVIAYAWIFVDAKLYSDMLLQAIFAVLILYGWRRWMSNLDESGHVRVTSLSPREAAQHLAIGSAAALALGYAMHRYTDASLPWLDAALTAFSLVAQWWQARRHAAAWWLWIAVDVFYVGEYVYKSLPVTAVLYVGLIVLAAMGLKAWRHQVASAPA